MKSYINLLKFTVACVLLLAIACDPERNKASLGNSADTLHTESAKHKDSTTYNKEDSTQLQQVPSTQGNQ
jgi:hypothetical protein